MKGLLNRIMVFVFAFVLSSGCFTHTVTVKAATPDLKAPSVSEDKFVTWDCIYFGSYYQTNSTVKEPVKWRILSVNGTDAFILADQNLDCKPYNTGNGAVPWEDCTLRTWLNTDFYNTAFNNSEKNAIKMTAVVNDGNNTQDRIYVLSSEEADNEAYGLINKLAQGAKNTEYTKNQGAYTYEYNSRIVGAYESGAYYFDGFGSWWLRSIATDLNVYFVDYGGGVYQTYKNAGATDYGVRPCLHINLSSNAWSYAGTVCSDGTAKGPEETKESDTKDSDHAADPTSKESSSGSSKAKSKTYTVGAFSYTLDNNAATVAAPKRKTTKTVTIPATIKVNGKSVPVTAIAANAFKGMKNLTAVTIGKNVKTIGKNAFNGCKKLKKITIKTTKLIGKTIGANVFKGINKKAVFKCPKSKKAAYKKILLKKGAKKTMSFK